MAMAPAGSLSAADLQVVVLGDPYVGIIHPCKIYNTLTVGAPILYIGPEASHISDIFASMRPEPAVPSTCYSARHRDVAGVLDQIKIAVARYKNGEQRGDPSLYAATRAAFTRDALVPKQVGLVEGLART